MPTTSLTRVLPFIKGAADLRATQVRLAQEEITSLFEEMRNALLRYALSLGLPSDDGEEVVQEAFLALFRHLTDDKPRSNLQGWLFRVVHNLGLKKRTHNSLHLQRHQEPGMIGWDHKPDPAPSVEQRLLNRQKHERMQTMLKALPEQDRFCFHLRAEGLRYREIANILGISLGGVALSLQRTLTRLRAMEMQQI